MQHDNFEQKIYVFMCLRVLFIGSLLQVCVFGTIIKYSRGSVAEEEKEVKLLLISFLLLFPGNSTTVTSMGVNYCECAIRTKRCVCYFHAVWQACFVTEFVSASFVYCTCNFEWRKLHFIWAKCCECQRVNHFIWLFKSKVNCDIFLQLLTFSFV